MLQHMKILDGIDRHPVSVAALVIVLALPLILISITTVPLGFAIAGYINIAALTLYDFRAYRLPNLLTLSFFLLATLHAYFMGAYFFTDHLIGAGVGLMVPILINLAYRKLRGRDGIGLGDAKLLAGSGMLLAWPNLPLILSIASTLGLGYALLRFGRKRADLATIHIPFGPFIGFATLSLWLYN